MGEGQGEGDNGVIANVSEAIPSTLTSTFYLFILRASEASREANSHYLIIAARPHYHYVPTDEN
jgi:hypothetical protein